MPLPIGVSWTLRYTLDLYIYLMKKNAAGRRRIFGIFDALFLRCQQGGRKPPSQKQEEFLPLSRHWSHNPDMQFVTDARILSM